jgi:hypothetical protein
MVLRVLLVARRVRRMGVSSARSDCLAHWPRGFAHLCDPEQGRRRASTSCGEFHVAALATHIVSCASRGIVWFGAGVMRRHRRRRSAAKAGRTDSDQGDAKSGGR